MTTLLKGDFLDHFDDFPAHMTPIGKFTYLRTYSRYLTNEARRETWKETVRRASEYNVGLARAHAEKIGIPVDEAALTKEAQLLFQNQHGLKQALSGRTLWVGGAENGVADQFPLANFNCSFTNVGDQEKPVTSFDDLAELFYLLLVGTGVGFKVTPQMAASLPGVRQNVAHTYDDYEGLPKWMRNDQTVLITDEVVYNPELRRYEYVYDYQADDRFTKPSTTAVIAIGDSKEGWVEALRQYFNILTDPAYSHIVEIRFNFNSIRPEGERLKTFGGTASGHTPLMEMFQLFDKVIHNTLDASLPALGRLAADHVQLRPIHIADMANGVGHNVVVGGVRRTSEIYLFSGDPDNMDWESLFMKFGINGVWGEDGFKHLAAVRKAAEANNFPLPNFFEALEKRHYDVPDGDKKRTFTDKQEAERYAYEIGIDDYVAYPYNATRTYLGHRRMSNNSIAFHTEQPPSKRLLDFIFLMMRGEGEPGFINLYEAAKRRLKHMGITDPQLIEKYAYGLGLNPCAEILLASKGVCNLTTVNVMAFVKDGALDLVGLLEAQALSARAGVRMTLVTLELPNWDKVQQRDRLAGTSLTGWMDAMGAVGYSAKQQAQLLKALRITAREEADRYAKELRVNAPLLVTTVKPEGTLSIVFGAVSSGLHVAHAPYYIRRIRINAQDALAKTVQELPGWRVYAEVGTAGYQQEEELERPDVIAQARTLVIDFPVKSGAKKTKAETLVDEQFDTYFMFQKNYTEHNTSNTIHLQEHEWERAAERVYAGWSDFVGVSFLALDGGGYKLTPYEQCPEEVFEELVEQMVDFDYNLLQQFDKPQEVSSLDGMDACDSGVCPVR